MTSFYISFLNPYSWNETVLVDVLYASDDGLMNNTTTVSWLAVR